MSLYGRPRLGFALARGADLARTPWYKRFHLARRAVFLELLLEDLVDLAVFVAVLDLPTALLETP
ncbi:MAG: hypothetical protein ACREQP_06680, partial [Candidatus Binatia bacterium]